MIRNFTRLVQNYGHTYKSLQTTAETYNNGLRVIYPHQKNAITDIENPLETFISTIAACETSILKAYSRRKNFKLGKIHWTRIESKYDVGHLLTEGGPDNLIEDVFIEGEIETDLYQEDLEKMKTAVENLCPVYQMVKKAGITIHSKWTAKHLDKIE